MCLAANAIGQNFQLHARRPGPETNRIFRASAIRAGGTIIEPNGEVAESNDENVPEESADPPVLTRVDVRGVLEQRAGYHSECGGYSDGHDALAERLIAALEETDVLLVMDSPGGAHAGLEQAVERVLREKEEHGRRITGYVDEMCGSAMLWWAASICDEIWAPPAGVIGSIGARAAHVSEAGALAKAGVEVTFFAWPSDGKVAFASELPLSDIGRQRGMRDVGIAGEAFAAAVGPARGMTREEIVELSADALCGQMAVDAKLLDGLASYEEVLQYSIVHANAPKDPEMTIASQTTNTHVAGAGLAVRAEDDAAEKPMGKEPDGVCKACGHQQEEDAKYCDQCGDSMEAAPLEDPDGDGDGDDDKKKDSSDEKPKPAATPPPPMKETRGAGASFASLLGLRKGASDIAIKTALVRKLQVVDYVGALTGVSDEGEMLGQLRAMSEDAKQSGQLRRSSAELRKRTEASERLDLLKSLAAANLPEYPRGNLLIDEVNESGVRTSVKPAPLYAETSLATLRGLVKGKLANAAPGAPGGLAAQSPYVAQPDPAKASAAVFDVQLEAAKKHPVVLKAVRDGVSLETAAATYVRNFGGKS